MGNLVVGTTFEHHGVASWRGERRWSSPPPHVLETGGYRVRGYGVQDRGSRGRDGCFAAGTRMMIRVASWLGAAWVLMATPTVAAPRVMDGRWGGVATDRTRSRDRVTVVEVRPMRQVHATTDSTGRRLTTRHVVRGHWTHQPYGVGRSRRRLQWIAPFIRGPQEAPFVATDTVNVWRR